jgi:CHAT domain-containing protein
VAAADTLTRLVSRLNLPEVNALADWTRGVAALAQGQMEHALVHLDAASAGFADLNKASLVAETRVPKVMALAMLGRYEEAEVCGLSARHAFLQSHNHVAAAKIDLNLGHMWMRRDEYARAEAMYLDARDRLAEFPDQELSITVAIALADASMWQQQFDRAASLYDQAIHQADTASLRYLKAIAQIDLGILERLRGRYDKALALLESARRIHAELDTPFQVANAEQYLADVYLDLHMASEALMLYERALPVFEQEGLRHEQAWMLAHRGQALRMLQRLDEAMSSLQSAHALFLSDENAPSAAMVEVLQAELALIRQEPSTAESLCLHAEPVLGQANARGWLLRARWLRGESLRMRRAFSAAEALLSAVLSEGTTRSMPHIVLRCHVSLGQLYAEVQEDVRSEAAFLNAINIIESQRASLPAEEFRSAFLASQLTPYAQLTQLALQRGDIAAAFMWSERSRSRTLLDMLHGMLSPASHSSTEIATSTTDESTAQSRLDALRAELNWCYTQLNEREGLSARAREQLLAFIGSREQQVQEIQLQLRQHAQIDSKPMSGAAQSIDLAQLQASLGDDTMLLTYFALNGMLMAFLITKTDVRAVQQCANESHVETLVVKLRFQLDALRHGAANVATHIPQLLRRAQHYLRALHDALIRPVLTHIDTPRLVIVPHGVLHYIPFVALFDGERYLVDAYEICTAPSAAVLQHCLNQRASRWEQAVLLGVPDERAVHMRDEVQAIQPLFPRATPLLDSAATLPNLRAHVALADVVHLACHGVFRPDNPFFSSLRLADGWMTVRDAYSLDLRCGLVTLSACETGVSGISPGDELIGLARGFISAGTPSLLVSMWVADDAATAELMRAFYANLLSGRSPAAALRAAQIALRRTNSHPFFWAAFTLIGRW